MSRQNHQFIELEKNRIDFLDVRFYMANDGNWYPSATTILDAYPKNAAFYDWLKKNGEMADAIRDDAGERGSVVHNLTERYDLGDDVSLLDVDGKIKYRQIEWAMFERYIEFCNRTQPEVLGTEISIVSPELGYGGTIDRIVRLNGKKTLVDIKTSNMMHNHYWLQLACYVNLYHNIFKEEEKITNVAILWLNAKTRTEGKPGSTQGIGWNLIYPEKELDHYWRLFRATHALWLEENKNARPRNLSYQITHKK